MKSTNYYNTLIQVADDSEVGKAQIPPHRAGKKTVATMQYEMLFGHPYEYTSDDVLFSIHAQRNDLAKSELKDAKTAYFSKGQACFRASPLPKKYGWGIHSDDKGRIAIIPLESDKYANLSEDINTAKTKALRSKRQLK